MSRNGNPPITKHSKKKLGGKGDQSRPKVLAGDQDDSPENLELADEAEMTWSDLFGDGSEQIVVELIRMAPAFVGDVPCLGFCGNLQPGASLQTIKDLYGGGRYKLQKKVDGRFLKGGFRYIEIVGIPIIPARPTAVSELTVTAKAPGANTTPGAAATITVDGVTLPADFQNFKQSMMEIMLFKAALKEPDPINTKLLELALNQAGSKPDELTSILGALGKIKDIATEIAPAASSGDGWMGLVSKGLDAFVSFMKTKQPGGSPGFNFAEAAPTREITTGKEPVLLPERTGEVPVGTGDQVSLQQKIQAGISIIVAGFKLQPAKEIPAVVDILNETLGIAATERISLVPFKQNLFDKAELMLADDFACTYDPAQERRVFGAYFDSVFNQYCGVTE
jgi:hypothetical protein